MFSMSNMNGFVESLSKERLLCFFILLFGISYLWGGIVGLIYYASSEHPSPLIWLSLLNDLISIGAGGALTLFGIKLLRVRAK